MTAAFEYRARRDAAATQKALVGSSISFDEQSEYVLSFPGGCPPPLARHVAELGGEFLQDDTAVISFRNFVGRTELGGVAIDIISTKIGAGGVSQLLEQVSALASDLIFGWRAPTGFAAAGDLTRYPPVPYHQLQFLRRMMLGEVPGRRLQDWLATVERNPTRRFEPERPVVSPDRVRRMDQRALQSIFTRLDRLLPVETSAPLAANALARALTFGAPPTPHFPALIAAPRGRLSFDTAENRFVKHAIGESLALVYRFVDHPKLHPTLLEECRLMLGILEQAAAAPFLAEAGRLAGFAGPTQALAKADGYREIFAFWMDLTRHFSLPLSGAETALLLEGRDVATLYEYWVFLKVLEAVVAVTGKRPTSPPEVHRDEMGESLSLGLSVAIDAGLKVYFNPTYRRSSGTAYSTPLRPDVVIELDGVRQLFDAKYRLERFDIAENDPDDDPATYKRADLYKMHTYRDAIRNVGTAFVVYPGTEFVFFERTGARRDEPEAMQLHDGVGAVPLRPADAAPETTLQQVVRKLLTPPA